MQAAASAPTAAVPEDFDASEWVSAVDEASGKDVLLQLEDGRLELGVAHQVCELKKERRRRLDGPDPRRRLKFRSTRAAAASS